MYLYITKNSFHARMYVPITQQKWHIIARFLLEQYTEKFSILSWSIFQSKSSLAGSAFAMNLFLFI